MAADTIDFWQGDVSRFGQLFVIIVLSVLVLSLVRTKKAELFGGGWKQAGRTIAVRLLLGLLAATLVCGSLMIWNRLPPRRFTKLRLETDRVVLGFHWPEPEIAIPISDLRDVRVVTSKTRRYRYNRFRIQTATETHLSCIYGRINEDDRAVMEKFGARVGPGVAVPDE